MALQDTDLLYVQRGDSGFKTEYSTIKSDIAGDVDLSVLLPLAGGNMTGAVTSTEVAITDAVFDLSQGNFFSSAVDSVPAATNGVNGQSGLIRFTVAPSSLDTVFKTPDGFDIAAASVVPFYVKTPTEILLGNPVEVS